MTQLNKIGGFTTTGIHSYSKFLKGQVVAKNGILFPTQPQRLSVNGQNILDNKGNVIILRGYNWGHEDNVLDGDAADHVAQGANCVRIPLRWWGNYPTGDDSRLDGSPGHINNTNLLALDHRVALASAQGLWIIFFLDSNCGQNGTQDAGELAFCDPTSAYGPSGHNFWTDLTVRQLFIEAWQFLANRYKNTPYIGMYELMPEPNPPGVSNTDVSSFYQDLITAVRTVEPNIPFLIGPNNDYNMNIVDTSYIPTGTPIVYTGNLFISTTGTLASIITAQTARINNLVTMANTHNVPVFVQQTGALTDGDPDQSIISGVLGVLNTNNIGWTYWEFRAGSGNTNTYGVYIKDLVNVGQWIQKTGLYNALTTLFHA